MRLVFALLVMPVLAAAAAVIDANPETYSALTWGLLLVAAFVGWAGSSLDTVVGVVEGPTLKDRIKPFMRFFGSVGCTVAFFMITLSRTQDHALAYAAALVGAVAGTAGLIYLADRWWPAKSASQTTPLP